MLMERTLFGLDKEIKPLEHLEDVVAVFNVFFKGPHGMYDTVVHIEVEVAFSNFFFELIVHHCLEGTRGVGQSEEHNCGFKQSVAGFEGGFPLVTFFNTNIIVAPANIEFCVPFLSGETMDEIRYQW